MALAETETWQGGFIRDDSGNLVVTTDPAEEVFGTVVPGFLTDGDGRLVATYEPDEDTRTVVPGFVTDTSGRLAIASQVNTPVYDVVPGFATNAAGYLSTQEDPSLGAYEGGFVRDTDAAIAVGGTYVTSPYEDAVLALNPSLCMSLGSSRGTIDLSGNGRGYEQKELGVTLWAQEHEYDSSPDDLSDYIAATGHNPPIMQCMNPWAPNNVYTPFPLWFVRDVCDANGIKPVISWYPEAYPEGPTDPDFNLNSIIAGDHDEYIAEWAESCAGWGKLVTIRLMHEFNGDWLPYCTQVQDNTEAKFISAWTHIVDMFNDLGVTNVEWAWCVSHDQGSDFVDAYPGDDYVDYLGLDAYERNVSSWLTPEGIFGEELDLLASIADKPTYIYETGTIENASLKPVWFADMSAYFRRRPEVVGLIYFNRDQSGEDFRVNSSAGSLTAWQTYFVKDHYWGAGRSDTMTVGGYAAGPLTVGDDGATDFAGTAGQKIGSAYTTRRNRAIRPSTRPGAPVTTGAVGSTITAEVGTGEGDNGYFTRATVTSDGDSRGGYTHADHMIPVVAGQTVTMSFKLLALPDGKACYYGIEFKESDKSTPVAGTASTTTTTLGRKSITKDAVPATAEWASPVFYIYQGAVIGDEIDYDGVMLEVAASAGTFFTGDGYIDDSGDWIDDPGGHVGWLGTAHASASDKGCFANGTVRSFAGWYWRDVATANYPNMFGGGSSTAPAFRLQYNANDFNFYPDGTSSVKYINKWPGDQQWVHVVLVFDEPGNAITLYVNGTSAATTSSYAAQWTPSDHYIIGGRYTDLWWDGKIAWPTVFEYGLTAPQVAAIYAAGLP